MNIRGGAVVNTLAETERKSFKTTNHNMVLYIGRDETGCPVKAGMEPNRKLAILIETAIAAGRSKP